MVSKMKNYIQVRNTLISRVFRLEMGKTNWKKI